MECVWLNRRSPGQAMPGRPTAAPPLLLWLMAGGAAAWLALAAPAAVEAQEADPVALARAFGAAWNAHDLDAVAAFFAPDGVVHVPGTVWRPGDDGGRDASADAGDVF